MEVDPELVVPDPQATLGEGAIQPWSMAHVADYFLRLLGALGEELGFDLDTPWEDLPAKAQKSLLDGHPTKVHVVTTQPLRPRSAPTTPSSRACVPYIERRHREAESDTSRERFEGFMREVPCPACAGQPAQAGVDGGHPGRTRTGRQATSPRSARCRSTRPPSSCATST